MRKRKYHDRRRYIGRRKKSPESIFWIITLIILVVGGGAFAIHIGLLDFLQANDKPTNVEVNQVLTSDIQEEETAEPPVWEPRIPTTHTNILLLGLDNHGMCDTVMIISYHMETFNSAIISIKRDTFIEEQTWGEFGSGQNHLAWANQQGMGPERDYHAGAMLTAKTVEELLGLELHAYASITFDGFTELIDLLGGVVVDVAPEFSTRQGTPLPIGRQRLNGEQALIYARHRQNPRIPEPGSDSQHGDRIRRNQKLLRAILEQCKTLDSNELLQIADQLEDSLYTTLDDWDILDLANVLYNRDLDEIESIILPGTGERVYEEQINTEIYYFFLDFEKTDLILGELGLK